MYREPLTANLQPPELNVSLGHALKALGRRREALAAYRAAAVTRPGFGEAYWGLADLETYRFAHEEITRMWAQEASPCVTPVDRYHLCFALGKALEERGEFELSFRYYERGNRLKRQESRYDSDTQERAMRRLTAVCGRDLFASGADAGPRPGPIFIVGLPCAGVTLIERILAAHSRVDGPAEPADIAQLVGRVEAEARGDRSGGYPAVLRELTATQLERLGKRYLAGTAADRRGKAYFTDETSENFRHIGLIRLIAPQAKIIDVRRDPMACCFSSFKRLFPSDREFTYSLKDLGRHYRAYVRLMRHWDEVLPGWILHVRYEELLGHFEATAHRILDFTGLSLEPACLRPRRARPGRVSDPGQPPRPLHHEGPEQWRHFEPWLKELKSSLGDLLAA